MKSIPQQERNKESSQRRKTTKSHSEKLGKKLQLRASHHKQRLKEVNDIFKSRTQAREGENISKDF